MGRKHYSGKELLYRRALDRQKEEKKTQPRNRLRQQLKIANSAKEAVKQEKERQKK